MAKKPYTPFADTEDGRLFVRLDSFMHPFCAFADGLPITFFGKENVIYTDIDTAIKWCEKESTPHTKKKYDHMIDIMRKAKQQHANDKSGAPK